MWSQWLILRRDYQGSRSGRPENDVTFSASVIRNSGGWRVDTLHVHPIDENGNDAG